MMGTTPAEIAAAIVAAGAQGEAQPEADAPAGAVVSRETLGDAPPADTPPPEPEGGKAPDEAKPADEDHTQGKPPAKTWAALFRQQRQVRERETAMGQQLEALKAREAEATQRAEKADALLRDFEADKYKFVSERGFSYDDWAKRHLNEGKPDPTQSLAQQLEQLKAHQAEREKAMLAEFQQMQAKQAHEARANQWMQQLSTTLEDPKYAVIKAWDAQNDVVELQTQALKTHGKWLTPDEAAGLIQSELNKRIEKAEKAGLVNRTRPNQPKQAAATSPEASTGTRSSSRKTSVDKPPRALTPRQQREEDIERMSKQLRWR